MKHTLTLNFYGDAIMLVVALLNRSLPFSFHSDGESFVFKLDDAGSELAGAHEKYINQQACWS